MRRPARIVLIVVAAALVVAAAVALMALYLGNADSPASPSASTEPSKTSSPAVTPSDSPTPPDSPTPSSTQEPAPSPLATDEVQPEPTPAGPGTVTIVNSGADGDFVYATGIVTGDVRGDGTCTLTATSSNGQTLIGRRDAQSTPAAVNCGVIQIQAPSGEWTLVLAYESENSRVTSEPTVVTQP